MTTERPRVDTKALKQAIPLVEIARQYTTLKQISQRGEFAGPCPLCGGRDRFHVKGERFYCRQCRPRGGDVIDLVQLVEGISFKNACERLAGPFACSERPSPILPVRAAPPEEGSVPVWRTESFQRSAQRTLKATQRRLLSREGAAGQHYLLGRGLMPETWYTYQLGFGTSFHPWQQCQMPAIFIPWFTSDGAAISAMQHRFFDPTLAKAERYALKPGSQPLVFGLQALTPADLVVVVEGEFNGMTLHQVGLPALSIGSETNRNHHHTLALLQTQLAPYPQIAVWLDQPAAGQHLAELLQHSQPVRKEIMVIDSHGQDANELLCTDDLYTFLQALSLL